MGVTASAETAAIVTGAAGGMGSAIARAFAAEGRALILTDLHPAPLEALAEALGGKVPVVAIPGDVTDPALLEQLWAALDGRRIGALVHAAGVSPSMADGKRVFAINFTATRQLVEAALPHMAVGGTAILIASNSGQMVANPLIDRAVRRILKGRRSLLARLMLRNPRGAYPLSKRAVQLYVPMMANSFGKVGARIVSLSPGIIDTDMGRLENQAGPEMGRMIEAAALARMGRADEIASAAAFLASDAASYISGTDLLADGGTIAGVAAAGGAMKLMR